ncbi:hypothetical protein METBIDRAFT_12311 [Metschnikowia bicuspidata var. bicuspidata NRRL YB-4993]|uniref:Myb-like domain-containing protein n=1 Tax=Metschnikowia bicuspidata var. bicuspidata NRRL YB-4993 TaxID=869754 RepID=A0A1A0H8Q6_9ASCO|nr:hypothetical protein METBIDRAFT_12311 [Metschnikowia bicuspidata var. bicuspidata NRRL YB-4993]OBA20267.1 hypothetical protein METBIDRAFT_12311 [Metschnikowia bicuspidata var. bicuspidata NRRL YB-4993]
MQPPPAGAAEHEPEPRARPQNTAAARATLSPAYAADFDRHVAAVFSHQYTAGRTAGKCPSMRLHPSKNTPRAAYYLPRPRRPGCAQTRPLVEHLYAHLRACNDGPPASAYAPPMRAEIDRAERVPGTLWSAQEKDVFFLCLARYSVHRLELFSAHLPHKTRVEIEAYYLLLKAARDRLVRFRTYDTAVRTSSAAAGARKLRCAYTMRVCEPGLSYWRIPAAVEVDAAWMDFEDEQSALLARRELARLAAALARQAHAMETYTARGGDTGTNVVDACAAADLGALYQANGITPAVRSRGGGRLALLATVFLDELVKMRTRDMLLAVVAARATATTAPAAFADALPEKTVCTDDIWRAAEHLRLFETRAAGHSSKFRDGKTPVIATYWDCVVRSLKLPVDEPPEALVPTAAHPALPVQDYRAQDFFLRQLAPPGDALEIPEGLAELTAAGVSEEGDISNGSESPGMGPECWQLPAPWDHPDMQHGRGQAGGIHPRFSGAALFGMGPGGASLQDSTGTRGMPLGAMHTFPIGPAGGAIKTFPIGPAGGGLLVPGATSTDNGIVIQGAPPANSSILLDSSARMAPHAMVPFVAPNASDGSMHPGGRPAEHHRPEQILFASLERSETFSRKRDLEDILVEDYLEQDVAMYTDSIDQRKAWRYLKSLKETMGIDAASSPPPKLRKRNVMFRSAAHKAWAKHYASY